MKKIIKSSFYVLCAVIITAIFVGCGESEGSDNGSPATIEDYYVYLDSWNADIDTDNLNIQASAAPNVFTLADVDDGKEDATGKALQLNFTGLTSGGENGLNAQFKNAKDLSAYNALTFWIKAEPADAEIQKILVLNGAVDGQYLWLKHSGQATLDTAKTNVFGSTWRKVTIPIFNSAYLKSSKIAVQISHEHASAALGTFSIDELKYTKSDTLPTVASITYSTTALSTTTAEGALTPLPGTITIALNDMGTGDAIIEDTTKAQVTWISADESIATVDSASFTITGKATGTTTIKGKLTGTDIEGPDITVTVTDAPLKYYFYTDATTAHATDDSEGTAAFTHFGGYENTMTATETPTGGADATDKYLSLQGSSDSKGWAAGGWGAAAGTTVDLAFYNTLVFWAKSATAATIKFAIEDGDNNDPEASATIGTTWSEYRLPFHELKVSDASTIETLKYVLPDTAAQVDIDEVYLEHVAYDATPTAVSYPADFEIWVPVGVSTAAELPGTALISTVSAGTIEDPSFSKLFVSNAAQNRVTPSSTSVSVTGASVGADTLTLSLIEDSTKSGPTLTARVIATDANDAHYYFYGATLDYAGPFYPGYGGTITTTHLADSSDNDNAFLQLTDANAQDWAASGFKMPEYLDISPTHYTYLVVKARAVNDGSGGISGTAELDILLKFGADETAGAKTGITGYDSNGAATPTALTLNWQTYKIPISVLKGTLAETVLSELSVLNLEFPGDAAKTTEYKVEIDEIYFASQATAPDAITDLAATATAGSDTSIDLTWTAPASAGLDDDGTTSATIANYVVYYQEGGTVDPAVATSLPSQTTLSATVTGLKIGTRYTFVVLARNNAGLSSASNEILTRTTGTPDKYYLFSDATGVSLHVHDNWDFHMAAEDSLDAEIVATGGANNTDEYLKLSGNQGQSYAAGGWEWGVTKSEAEIVDFSEYQALVFWARNPDAAASGRAVSATVAFMIVDSSITKPQISRPGSGTITTTWTKYEIPLTEFTDANSSLELNKIVAIKYVLQTATSEIYLDEIYLRKIGVQ